MPRDRRLPERTCLGCRTAGPKRTLLRVVRTPEGTVRLDPTGRAAGRGAYVHPSKACIRGGIREASIARALRTRLSPAEAARLMGEVLEMAGDNT